MGGIREIKMKGTNKRHTAKLEIQMYCKQAASLYSVVLEW